MKKIILVFLVLVSTQSFSQQKKSSQDNKINPFKLKGIIEINGHQFQNDSIWFKSDLDGINIYDKKNHYIHRKCRVDSCKIIHLIIQQSLYLSGSIQMTPNYIFNHL